MAYDIPAKPAFYRGIRMASTNEAKMMGALEERGNRADPYPMRFWSVRWGQWTPDAGGPVATSDGKLLVLWEFKYAGWLQRKGDFDGVPERMLGAYESIDQVWPVIAQPDGWMRLVYPEGDGAGMHRLVWHREQDGTYSLLKGHSPI